MTMIPQWVRTFYAKRIASEGVSLRKDQRSRLDAGGGSAAAGREIGP